MTENITVALSEHVLCKLLICWSKVPHRKEFADSNRMIRISMTDNSIHIKYDCNFFTHPAKLCYFFIGCYWNLIFKVTSSVESAWPLTQREPFSINEVAI